MKPTKSYKRGGEINPDSKNVKDYFAHSSGSAGGVLIGNRHSEGGIKAVNKSNGQPLEMEGGEVVITRNAVSDTQKREFEGEMLTNKEILSRINQSGGGIAFAEGGEVPDEILTTGKTYNYGGNIMKDSDIVSSCGCKHKMSNGGKISKSKLEDRLDERVKNQTGNSNMYQKYLGGGRIYDKEMYSGGGIIKSIKKYQDSTVKDAYNFVEARQEYGYMVTLEDGRIWTGTAVDRADAKNQAKEYFGIKGGKLRLEDIPETVKAFMPKMQQLAIVGTEELWEVIERLEDIINRMPKTYETEKQKMDDKVVYLHYFYGGSDWYIVEKDMEKQQYQAFGYAILNGDTEMAEWGYIDIEGLKATNKVELDFYFEPIRFGDIKKKWSEEEKEMEYVGKNKNSTDLVKFAYGFDIINFLSEQGLTDYEPYTLGYDEESEYQPAGRYARKKEYPHTFLSKGVLESAMETKKQETLYNDAIERGGPSNQSIIEAHKAIDKRIMEAQNKYDQLANERQNYIKVHGYPVGFDADYDSIITEKNKAELVLEKLKKEKYYLLPIPQKEEKSTENVEISKQPDYLFIGSYPNATVYSDRTLTDRKTNDYTQIARVVYSPLEFKVYDNSPKYKDALEMASKEYQELYEEKFGVNPYSNKNQNVPIDVMREEAIPTSNKSLEAMETKELLEAVQEPNTIDEFNEGVFEQVEPQDSWIGDFVKERDVKQQLSNIVSNASAEDIDMLLQEYKGWYVKNSETEQKEISPKVEQKEIFLMEKFKNASQVVINNEIRALVSQKGIDRERYSADELSFIQLYEGGGAEKKVRSDKSILTQFFTPEDICSKMWGLAIKHGFRFNGTSILEPSVGTGRFLKYIPKGANVNVTAFEIEPIAYRISKILYPEYNINLASFETMFFKGRRHVGLAGVSEYYDLVITNPPYADYVSEYAPLGEREATGAFTFEMYFLMRGVDVLKSGGLLVYVIPNTFMNNGNKYNAFKEKLAQKCDLLEAYRLPNGVFGNTDVGTDILVLKKK